MSGLKIVTGPAVEPISRVEARDHLRLDEDVDDSQVRIYIQAATEWAENYTNKAFISRTVQMMLDGATELETPLWEGVRTGPSNIDYCDHIELAMNPVTSVQSIKYHQKDDTEVIWATSNYQVDTFSEPARIVLKSGGSYPSDLRAANGLEINFTAGYGPSPSNVPEAIRVAILQYVTFLYEHRGDYEGTVSPPVSIGNLLDPYRVLRFGATPYNKMLKTGVL